MQKRFSATAYIDEKRYKQVQEMASYRRRSVSYLITELLDEAWQQYREELTLIGDNINAENGY